MSNIDILDSYTVYKEMPIETKFSGNVKSESYGPPHNCPQRRIMQTINASSAFNPTAIFGSQVQFRLEDQVDRIESVYLRISLTNNGGVNAVISIPENFLSQVQVYSANGSYLLLNQLSSDEVFLSNNLSTTRTEFETISAQKGTNDQYTFGTLTLLPGTTSTYFIPLCQSFWRSCNVRPYSAVGNFLLRLNFNKASAVIESGAVDVTDCVLRIAGEQESEGQKQLIVSRAQIPKNFFYYNIQRHIQDLNLAAGAQTTTIRLSGLIGICSSIVWTIKNVVNIDSPSTHFGYDRCEAFEFLDSGNQSFCGHNPIRTDSDMYMLYSNHWSNKFIKYTGAHVYSFSEHPANDLLTGGLSGVVLLDGYANLRFTTPSTWGGGSYQIAVYAFCSENLRYRNGNVTSSRS